MSGNCNNCGSCNKDCSKIEFLDETGIGDRKTTFLSTAVYEPVTLKMEFDNDYFATWASRLQKYITFLRGEGFFIPNGAVKIDVSPAVWGNEHPGPTEEEWYEGVIDSTVNYSYDDDDEDYFHIQHISTLVSVKDVKDKVFLTETEKVNFVTKVVAELDFDRIVKCVELLDWKYFGKNVKDPLVLREVCISNCCDAIDTWFDFEDTEYRNLGEKIVTMTGGFISEFTVLRENGKLVPHLFVTWAPTYASSEEL